MIGGRCSVVKAPLPTDREGWWQVMTVPHVPDMLLALDKDHMRTVPRIANEVCMDVSAAYRILRWMADVGLVTREEQVGGYVFPLTIQGKECARYIKGWFA